MRKIRLYGRVEIASFVVDGITINMGCEMTLAELKITAEMTDQHHFRSAKIFETLVYTN